MKKIIAAVLAVICVMGNAAVFSPASKNNSPGFAIVANAATTNTYPGFNAGQYSYQYADTSIYTTTISKVTNTVDKVDMMNWDDSTYSIFKVVVTHKDENDKVVTDSTEYRIGLYKHNATTLDVDFSDDVEVPEVVMNYMSEKIGCEITGNKVTVIYDSAFANSYLKTIDLTGIEFIGKKAFQKCAYITEVTIPECVKFVGNYAFDGSGLKTLRVQNDMPVIPDYLCSGTPLTKIEFEHPEFIRNVGDYAFKGTPIPAPFFQDWYERDLSNYEILEINDNAFEGCTSIKSIKMPKNLLYLNKAVFKGCTSISSVVFGENTIYADKECFANCTALDSIVFNDVLQSLGGGVFAGCTSLKFVKGMPNTLTDWVEYTSTTGYGFGNNMFANCTSLYSVELPTSLTKIPDTVFAGCKSLNTVLNTENMTSIGKSAFNGCAELRRANFPLVNTIGETAFKGCALMEEFNVGECTFVGKNALEGCASLPTITLKSDIYEEYVFKNCTKATTINIKSDSMVKVPKGLFSGCTALTKVNGEFSNIEIIGESAFENCSSLNNITFPSVRIIEKNAFANCTVLKRVSSNTIEAEDYGAKCFYIEAEDYGAKCFYNCPALDVEVTGTISTIGANAFQKSGITRIALNGMTGGTVVIGASAFADCPNLTNASILSPEKAVFSVGANVFTNCEKLDTVIYEGPIITASMFKKCTSLSSIQVSATTIQANAFEGCTKLRELIKRETNSKLIAKEMGTAAFKGCESLQSAVSDINTTFTGKEHYYGCSSLKSIETTYLYESMFTDCTSLSNVKLSGITVIPASAFKNCTSLKTLNLKDMQIISANSFYNSGLEKVVIDDAQTIDASAFANCLNLKTIDIAATTIGKKAFEKDTALTSAVIYAETIQDSAFSDCTALKSVRFRNDSNRVLQKVASSAFLNCNKLLEVVVPGSPTIGSKAFGFVGSKVNADFLLVGESGSSVETYATANKIAFCNTNEYVPGQRPQTTSYGDVNDDGTINAVDASLVLSAYALAAVGKNTGLTADQTKAADANNDGRVDAVDASLILSYYAYTATGGTKSFDAWQTK